MKCNTPLKNIRFVRYGDLVMINECSLAKLGHTKQALMGDDNEIVNELKVKFGCKRIALKSNIKDDNFRTPSVTLLHDHNHSDPWVIQIDNRIKYSFDITKSMFCKGNIKEKIRVSQIDCSNEIVVDLFAGIGYFSMVFAVHCKAKHVYCCEWNPSAIEALKRNAKLNKVQDRITVLEGDNRHTCPTGIANRVYMGLIPTSLGSLQTACRSLDISQNTPLYLHVHENVNYYDRLQGHDIVQYNNNTGLSQQDSSHKKQLIESVRKQWATEIANKISDVMSNLHSQISWTVVAEQIVLIKPYAPHIDHLVVDISCRQQQE